MTGVDSDICLLVISPTSLYWGWIWYLCTIYVEHLCKLENARWSKSASPLGKIICVLLTCVHSDICLLVISPTSLYWGWLSDICVLFMTRICVNAKMPDEVDRQVYSLVKIICVSLSGVDSDICLVMMTLTALYWCWLWYMCTYNDKHLCKCENARWSELASRFSR